MSVKILKDSVERTLKEIKKREKETEEMREYLWTLVCGLLNLEEEEK